MKKAAVKTWVLVGAMPVWAFAATFTWEGSTDRFWGNPASWSGGDGTYPNGTDDKAYLNNDFITASSRSPILLADATGNDMSVTIYEWGQSANSSGNRAFSVSNISGGSGTLTLEDVADGEALINTYNNANNYTRFNVPLVAKSNIRLNAGGNATGTKIFISGGLVEAGGSRSLRKTGIYDASIGSVCGHSGGTSVASGKLILTSGGTLGSGDVAVEGGTLELTTTVGAIDDAAELDVAAGAVVALGTGVDERVGSLVLDGVKQPRGMTFGSSSSGADLQSDVFFSGTGLLRTPDPEAMLLTVR